ncbi:MAG: DUF2461 domain-containing protein [Pseudomonadales bacterium]
MPTFTGYPAQTLKFLHELDCNNTRDWFSANKDRYEALVREPSLDFIATMGPEIQKISDHYVAIPRKVGGSLMRVYRDTRFGKDKTPYKTNIGIQFRHELARDVHAPGFYLHIDNTGCFLAAGAWRPESAALAKIRVRIQGHPTQWKKVRDARTFSSLYELGGTSLKRPPRGYSPTDPMIEDLKRKDFIASTEFSAHDIEMAGFVKQCGGAFKKASGLMAFLCAALEVPY